MLTLSEAATRKLQEILSQQTEPVFGLRVHVLPGGCSGWTYGMSLAEASEPSDWVGDFSGIKVLVDPQSAVMLEGAAIDWVETTEAQGFSITNPNAVRSCGCGGSHAEEQASEKTSSGGGCGCGGGGCGCGGH